MSLKPYKGLLIWLLLCSVTMAVRAEQPETTDLTNARDATALAAIQGLPPAIRNKIAPDLLKQFLEAEPEGGGAASGTLQPAKAAPITYLVFLRHRADLRGLNAIASKNDRRAAVVDRLKSAARRSQSELLDYLEERAAQGKIVRYKSYWVFNGLAVEGDLETALQLAKRPEVETIQPNRVYHLPEPQESAGNMLDTDDVSWNVAKIRADRVWRTLGITGEGIVVANMDSGVDWTHPALQRKYRGYNAEDPSVHDYNWFDYTEDSSPIPNDSIGHGTHTMGTMVGSEQDGSHAIGVAPGAQWIAVKIFDNYRTSNDERIHAGFQWCLAPTDLQGRNPDPSKAPDIVNNSWGYPPPGSLPQDPERFQQDMEAWRAAGIFSVWAAGNEGEKGAGSIIFPASLETAFAVGAVDESDTVAKTSSRGPSPYVEIKPDVVAPGVNITSCIPGGAYKGLNGTSMAAPHVAGLAALMWSAAGSDHSITDTEQIILDTSVDLGDSGPDTSYGYGRIDAYQALAAQCPNQIAIMPLIYR